MALDDFIKEHKDRLKNFLDKLTNDSHVPIALFVFVVTSVYHFHTGKDLGANYTSALYAFYGFLGGHALVYQKWPDQNQPTVDVNVQNNSTNTNTNSNTNSNSNSNTNPPAADPGTGSNSQKG